MPYASVLLLLLMVLPGPLLSPKNPVGGSGRYAPYLAKIELLLLQLNDEPTANKYDLARRGWEQINWLFPVHPPEQNTALPDNNYRWATGPAANNNYREAGLWQRLEWQVEHSPSDTMTIRRLTGRIVAYLGELQQCLSRQELAREDIRFLFATEIYRQYNLTLTGHHRLDSNRAKGDYLAFLVGLKQWDKTFCLFNEQGAGLLSATIALCSEPSFEHVDRYALYQDYLRPLYRSLVRGISVEDLAYKYKVAATADGELFSPAFMMPVSVNHSTKKTELGKLLFFDPLLSGNGRRSCASCHQPSKAYTDGRTTSMAFDYPNRITRNAPSLINVTTGYGSCGADMGKPSVGYFIQSVFDHPQELNVRMDSIVTRLRRSAGYRNAFRAAFPKVGIDSSNVLTALEAFILSLKGVDASFDREIRTPAVPSDSAAIRGFNLFMGKGACGSCHFPPYFDGRKPPFYRERNYQHAGRSALLTDLGVGGFLQDSLYNHYFRTSGIRNLKYSAPYGHDGYFITLKKFTEDHHGAKLLSTSEAGDLMQFLSTMNDSLDLSTANDIELPPLDNSLAKNRYRRPLGLY